VIAIGDDVAIGRFAMITAVESVRIGHGCLFSESIFISDHAHDAFSHDTAPLAARPLVSGGPVDIGPHCFFGIRAVIMPGVTLGEGCVVGANSVVTKSFPAYAVIAGAPARLIRTLTL
jgi:lipopolysaccharide O-acetyltransferase